MRFHITRDSRFIYHVMADDVVIGEIAFERGSWAFHYHARYPYAMDAENTSAVWKLINDQKNILNITSRLTG